MTWLHRLLGRAPAPSPSAFLAELAAEPWVMEPDRLTAFLSQIAAAQSALPTEARARSAEPVDAPPYANVNGVAHLAISGPIVKSVPWWAEWLGIMMTSTVDTHRALAAALDDPNVRSVMLRIDSPGGTVAGTQQLADAIFAARSRKPIAAYASDMAASGAYWLGSQAQRFAANQTAEIGSIGVYGVIVDDSAAAAAEGVKVHLVRSGPHKGVGVPGVEVTDANLAAEQAIVDGLAEIFVASVARGRGLEVEAVRALATGQTWLAEDARSRGLIDAVESLEAAHGQALAAGPLVAADGGDDMATNQELEAQLATARAELEASRGAQALSAAQATAMREQLNAVRTAQRTAMLDTAMSQGRVMPASRPAIARALDAFGDDVAGAETFLSSLPQITRPTPQGAVPAHTEPTATLPAGRLRGNLDPAVVARQADVDTWSADGSARLKDGRVVRLKDYLAGSPASGGAA